MKGGAPTDQSAEKGPKGTSTIPTSSPSCLLDISQSPPPYSPSIIPLHSFPPTISPITISPDIPIRVKYMSCNSKTASVSCELLSWFPSELRGKAVPSTESPYSSRVSERDN